MDELIIRSTQFERDDWIPDCCAGYGEDKSPELHVEGIPAGTVTLAIVMDDLDHPIQPGFNHWVAWNIPPVNLIPGGLPKGAVVEEPIHMEQGIAYGRHCYRGPKPPFNWNHRYRENMQRIKSGDLLEVARVIKGLMWRDAQRKGLSNGERKMLHTAKQILISEIVLVYDSAYQETENRLNEAMMAGVR